MRRVAPAIFGIYRILLRDTVGVSIPKQLVKDILRSTIFIWALPNGFSGVQTDCESNYLDLRRGSTAEKKVLFD